MADMIMFWSHDVANGSMTPVLNHVMEIRWGEGSLTLVLQANNRNTSCVHNIEWMRQCTCTRSFDPCLCDCPSPNHPSGGPPVWPRVKACTQVTQCPLVRLVYTSHRGLDRQAVSRLNA